LHGVRVVAGGARGRVSVCRRHGGGDSGERPSEGQRNAGLAVGCRVLWRRSAVLFAGVVWVWVVAMSCVWRPPLVVEWGAQR
jgi:hypothetical protein